MPHLDHRDHDLIEIVLTGGPCAGKTSSLAYIQQKLSDYGFRVFIVPELATMLTMGGLHDIGELFQTNYGLYFEIERHFLTMQRALRLQYRSLASEFVAQGERCVIIYDRAECDVAAYVSAEEFQAILDEERMTWFDVRDSYDGVIHLKTVADGKPEYYTQANNDARRETAEQAVEADLKTMNAWVGHPHLKIIDNADSFDGKLRRSLQAVSRTVGIPVPLEIERKFLLAEMPELPSYQVFEIEQSYLLTSDPNHEIRLRKRAQNGQATYYRTEKFRLSATTREEREEIISPRDYLRLLALKDPARDSVRKRRYTFVYDNQYFELDEFADLPGLYVLEVELTEENDVLTLPPFVTVEREVTDEQHYSNAEIARRLAEGL